MKQTQWIAADLERGSEGGAWHGPAIHQVLERVTASEAAARPVPEAHTIWEIVHHMTAWTTEVEARLRRFARPLDAEADWPPVTDEDPAAWTTAQSKLREAHSKLRVTIREFPPNRLEDGVPGASNERGASFYAMLHGLAQHDAYHTGQIAILKKANLEPSSEEVA